MLPCFSVGVVWPLFLLYDHRERYTVILSVCPMSFTWEEFVEILFVCREAVSYAVRVSGESEG